MAMCREASGKEKINLFYPESSCGSFFRSIQNEIKSRELLDRATNSDCSVKKLIHMPLPSPQ